MSISSMLTLSADGATMPPPVEVGGGGDACDEEVGASALPASINSVVGMRGCLSEAFLQTISDFVSRA